MKHKYYVRIILKPQLLYRTIPNKNGNRKPTSSLYSNAYGSTDENYLGFVCLVFFQRKGNLESKKETYAKELQ